MRRRKIGTEKALLLRLRVGQFGDGAVEDFGGLANAVALDRLHQEANGLALGIRGLVIGGVDLLRFVTAADELAVDVIIRQVGRPSLSAPGTRVGPS